MIRTVQSTRKGKCIICTPHPAVIRGIIAYVCLDMYSQYLYFLPPKYDMITTTFHSMSPSRAVAGFMQSGITDIMYFKG